MVYSKLSFPEPTLIKGQSPCDSSTQHNLHTTSLSKQNIRRICQPNGPITVQGWWILASLKNRNNYTDPPLRGENPFEPNVVYTGRDIAIVGVLQLLVMDDIRAR